MISMILSAIAGFIIGFTLERPLWLVLIISGFTGSIIFLLCKAAGV